MGVWHGFASISIQSCRLLTGSLDSIVALVYILRWCDIAHLVGVFSSPRLGCVRRERSPCIFFVSFDVIGGGS